MDVKDIIKSRRLELGLSMKELADKVNVSEGTISRWESGEIANMRRDKIVLLANALSVSPGVIMGWNNDQFDSNFPYNINLHQKEHSHILTYRNLTDAGKDRVDTYTERISKLEKQDEDSNIIEQFQQRFVARNGKNISPDQMQAIMDIIDGE